MVSTRLRLFGLIAILGGAYVSVVAQGVSAAPPSSPTAVSTGAQPSPSSDPRLIEIELAKLAEQQSSTKLTLLTIAVTGLIGFATVAYNLRNTNKQAQLQAKLKAIDVVISAAGPNSARERLIVVSKLLGSDLILETRPEDLDAAGIGACHDQNRKDLLKMLVEHPDKQLEVLDLWQIVFAKTNLGKNMQDLREHIENKRGSGDG